MVKIKQGDIVLINFDPSSGHEIKKRRPAVVVSNNLFNSTSNLRLVCPISHSEKLYSIAVPEGLKVDGFVLTEHIKCLDPLARNAEVIDAMPEEIITNITSLIKYML